MTTDAAMHIGELAERTGLSLRTLRHYDEIGLVIPSGRTEGGFRLYTADDEARVLLIRRMKPLGYSLEQMRELLDLIDQVDHDPDDPALHARLESVQQEALERRERLRFQLAAAEEFVDQLRARSTKP